MLIIRTLDVQGFAPAFYAMRHPLESYAKSDSYKDDDGKFIIGKNDMDLSMRLQKAGTEHCKHLRMVMVWADVTAPFYWWKEADTYRNGVEKLSCSTMHTLMRRPLSEEDFDLSCVNEDFIKYVLDSLNTSIDAFKCEKEDLIYKKEIWRSVIQALPESFMQKRTMMMSYAALRNIVRQREGHKLVEWKTFIDWVRTLPYANELIFDEERVKENEEV